MRVQVTLEDGVRIVVHGINFGYVHGAVLLVKNGVNDSDYMDFKSMEERYMCKVQRQEDLFGAKWVEIMIEPVAIKQVEFID